MSEPLKNDAATEIEPGTAMVPHKDNELALGIGPQGPPRFWTSLDPNKPEDAWMFQELMTDRGESIDKWIGKTFVAVHCLRHRCQKVDEESGELVDLIRTVLIADNGDTCAWFGGKATQCLMSICSMPLIGSPPWKPALPLEVTQVSFAGKKRMHLLKVPKEFLTSLAGKAPHGNKRRQS